MRGSDRSPMMLLSLVLLVAAVFTVGCQQQAEKRAMAVLDQYVSAWNAGDMEVLGAVADSMFELRMSPDFVARIGLDSLKAAINSTRSYFPDFTVVIDEVFFSGDRAAGRWTYTGTPVDPKTGQPSGNKITVLGTSIFYFSNGKVKGEWISANDYSLLKQLGYTFTPPAKSEE